MSHPDCIFCRITAGDLPADTVYEDEHVVAFRDLNPVAPIHILVVPRVHVESVDALDAGNPELAGHILLGARAAARAVGLSFEAGYRTVANAGADAGQTVMHLHLHVIGGRPMSWPPG